MSNEALDENFPAAWVFLLQEVNASSLTSTWEEEVKLGHGFSPVFMGLRGARPPLSIKEAERKEERERERVQGIPRTLSHIMACARL